MSKEREIFPVSKESQTRRASKAKGKGRTKEPKQIQARTNLPDSPRDRTEQNRVNRGFGKSIEREVAKLTGGSRVPGSGAFKQSVHNLTGDVEIFDDQGRVIMRVECKGTSAITPKGDKSFVLKKSVLDQAKKEAEATNVVGVVWVHWRDAEYKKDDYVIIPSAHFLQLVDWARTGAALER